MTILKFLKSHDQVTKSTILLFVALLSYFVVSNYVMTTGFHTATIESLNEKEITVIALAGSTAASSTLISLIPSKAAENIANQIGQLTPYFIMILGAIVLQKVLVGVVGYISFSIIIPFACALGVAYVYLKESFLRDIAIKLFIFGIILFAIIPTGVRLSDLLYETSQSSIQETIRAAEQNEKYVEDKKEDMYKEDRNWMEKVESYIANATSKIANEISQMIKNGENLLTAFLQSVTVMIITTCVIPIVVVLFFVWIVNLLFGFDMGKMAKSIPFVRSQNKTNQLEEDIKPGKDQLFKKS